MQLFGSLKVLMALLGSSCPLLGRSGPKMGPKMGFKSVPKSDQKMIQNMFKTNPSNRTQKGRSNELWSEIAGLRHFLPSIKFCFSFCFAFSLGFGALWLPLGSLLGFPEALLGSLWTQKRVKTQCFLMVLKRLFFGLWSSWWPSWAHLVSSWANLVPRWGFKMGTKSGQKGIKK